MQIYVLQLLINETMISVTKVRFFDVIILMKQYLCKLLEVFFFVVQSLFFLAPYWWESTLKTGKSNYCIYLMYWICNLFSQDWIGFSVLKKTKPEKNPAVISLCPVFGSALRNSNLLHRFWFCLAFPKAAACAPSRSQQIVRSEAQTSCLRIYADCLRKNLQWLLSPCCYLREWSFWQRQLLPQHYC